MYLISEVKCHGQLIEVHVYVITLGTLVLRIVVRHATEE